MEQDAFSIDFGFFLVVVMCFGFGFLTGYFVLRSWARKTAKAQLDKEKNEFIAIASHYLLTPLSIIEGAISTIQEHETTFSLEQRQDMHKKIKEGTERLLRIANQMLLVVRLEDGQLTLNKSIQSIADIIQQAISNISKQANNKNISIRLVADPNNKYEGQFDEKSMLQAIEAVLENATKFSNENSQVVILVEEDARDQRFIIEVRDQGIGMTAEQLQMAKDKFYRGTPPYQFDYEGIGLGLHIADVVVKAHGGQMIIQSGGQGRGTVVQLVLPK